MKTEGVRKFRAAEVPRLPAGTVIRVQKAPSPTRNAAAASSGTIVVRLCRRATWTGHRDGRTTYPNKHDPENGALYYIVRDLGQQPTTWMGTGCQPAAFTAQCETRVATWYKRTRSAKPRCCLTSHPLIHSIETPYSPGPGRSTELQLDTSLTPPSILGIDARHGALHAQPSRRLGSLDHVAV